jgi:hypothetical protein
MSQFYVNDVFISYTHRGAVQKWTQYFYELLEDWLPNYLPYQPKIFIDWEIEGGTEWPAELQSELKSSRCMLAIWSPVYFLSKWCMAEFESFRDREKMLHLRTEQKPSGLIYPVLFTSPPVYLPTQVKTIHYNDLSRWAITSPAFKYTPIHVEFENRVKKLCSELAKMILNAPDWRDDWPITLPQPPVDTPFATPRLQ